MSTLDRSCPDMKEPQTINFKGIDDGHRMCTNDREVSRYLWLTHILTNAILPDPSLQKDPPNHWKTMYS